LQRRAALLGAGFRVAHLIVACLRSAGVRILGVGVAVSVVIAACGQATPPNPVAGAQPTSASTAIAAPVTARPNPDVALTPSPAVAEATAASPSPSPSPTSSPSPVATPTPSVSAVPTVPPIEGPIEPWTGKNRLNIVVIGIDKAELFEGNTDVMMIASIDPATKSMFLLSIPRDICLGPCDGHSARINEVLVRKGVNEFKAAIRNLTGLPVHYWITVNFRGVERIITKLGDVRVYVPREFDERFVYLDTDEEIRLVLQPGMVTLNGREAVAYARSRKYDAGGDYARICRQQQVVRGLREQALTPQLIVNAPGVLASLRDAFKTDLPFDLVPGLAKLLLEIPSARTHSWTIPRDDELVRTYTGEDGANLLQPDVGAIRDYVRGIVRRSTLDIRDATGKPTFVRDNCREYYPA